MLPLAELGGRLGIHFEVLVHHKEEVVVVVKELHELGEQFLRVEGLVELLVALLAEGNDQLLPQPHQPLVLRGVVIRHAGEVAPPRKEAQRSLTR